MDSDRIRKKADLLSDDWHPVRPIKERTSNEQLESAQLRIMDGNYAERSVMSLVPLKCHDVLTPHTVQCTQLTA
jgi:hypothetical protein